jgi:hypothetical protein
MLLALHFLIFSERHLKTKENCSDFDSAIPWFESRRPSQPVASPWSASALGEKPRQFRSLAWVESVSASRKSPIFRFWSEIIAPVSGREFSISDF